MIPGQLDLEDFIRRGASAQTASQRAARDGMTQVAEHNKAWADRALSCIEKMRSGWIGTGEDVRLTVSRTSEQPGHPNAWGALIRAAVARGFLVKTGRYLPMKEKQSHGRITPEYRRA